MQGTASSLLALGCSLVSLAPIAFLSPTPNMALSRGAVADKRALQLQVFKKISSFFFGRSVTDRGASQSRLFRDKLDPVFFLSPSPLLDRQESG